MNIRPARAEDQATITAMVRGAHLNPMDLRWSRFLVAEDERGIVGVGQIRPHPGAPELASLVVREDRRGQAWAANSSTRSWPSRKERRYCFVALNWKAIMPGSDFAPSA